MSDEDGFYFNISYILRVVLILTNTRNMAVSSGVAFTCDGGPDLPCVSRSYVKTLT